MTIYRPPSSGKNATPFSEFITEFSHVLDRAATRPTEYVIVGDFNVHYGDLRRPDVRDLSELLKDNEYTQHVTEPTHVGGNILDLVITRDTPDNIVAGVSVDTLLSDHNILDLVITRDTPDNIVAGVSVDTLLSDHNILDLVITRDTPDNIVAGVSVDTLLSDHNILDLVITRDTPDNIVAGVSVDTLLSDHNILDLVITRDTPDNIVAGV